MICFLFKQSFQLFSKFLYLYYYMKSLTTKILIFLISLSFVLAVFEVNIGDSHNTFFDEYDTYFHSENQNVHFSIEFEKQKNHITYLGDILNYTFTYLQSNFISPSTPRFKRTVFLTHKIFLHNAVWRIWFGVYWLNIALCPLGILVKYTPFSAIVISLQFINWILIFLYWVLLIEGTIMPFKISGVYNIIYPKRQRDA